MSQRAQSQEETRQKIVEATMHLHEEIGPRATTISAIAEKAGVQRLTVYRHFPDETAIFQACTAHWLRLNPPPDPQSWADVQEPTERLRAALTVFYRYYSSTRRMWTVSHRDVADVPALQGPMTDFSGFIRSVTSELSAHFGVSGGAGKRIAATIGHALAFLTWSDLDERQIEDTAKVDLVERWVCASSKSAERLK